MDEVEVVWVDPAMDLVVGAEEAEGEATPTITLPKADRLMTEATTVLLRPSAVAVERVRPDRIVVVAWLEEEVTLPHLPMPLPLTRRRTRHRLKRTSLNAWINVLTCRLWLLEGRMVPRQVPVRMVATGAVWDGEGRLHRRCPFSSRMGAAVVMEDMVELAMVSVVEPCSFSLFLDRSCQCVLVLRVLFADRPSSQFHAHTILYLDPISGGYGAPPPSSYGGYGNPPPPAGGSYGGYGGYDASRGGRGGGRGGARGGRGGY